MSLTKISFSMINDTQVNVLDFGAVGDGVTDDIIAINKATATGKDVIFPGNFAISSSIIWRAQKLHGRSSMYGFDQSKITPSGNFPAFVNLVGDSITGEIDGFFIYYGDAVPTVATGNDQKYGFKITSNYPQFSSIKNCVVKGGWGAYYDDTGTYQQVLERIFSWNCHTGFTKLNGTTIKFDTCFVQGGIRGFYIKDTLSPSMINCAADQVVTTAGTFANHFENCEGLSIVGWDAENNTISGNAAGYFLFKNTTATLSGFVGFSNNMVCAAGEESYFFYIQNSNVTLNGVKAARDVTDLVFDGTGGNAITVAATLGAKVVVNGSDITKPQPGTGTPTNAYSAVATGTSSISAIESVYSTSPASIGFSDLSEVSSGTFTPSASGFTVTGSPIYSGRYSRNGKTVNYWIEINPNGGTVASVAATSVLGALPITPNARATCQAVNIAVVSYGNGSVTAAGAVYPPAWTATANIIVVQFSVITA